MSREKESSTSTIHVARTQQTYADRKNKLGKAFCYAETLMHIIHCGEMIRLITIARLWSLNCGGQLSDCH